MKIKNVHDYQISIAIGIRFRANFSIEDKLGNIVDEILYSKNSFFNPKMFPFVQSGTTGKVLTNETTENKLTIDNSNVILEYNRPEEEADQVEIGVLCDHFDRQIISGILKAHKITQINRVGFINRYLFNIESLAESFLDKTIGKTIAGVNDINLRFSKRYPVEESLFEKQINDYNNAIYNIIKKSDKKELFISLDYQRYFEPFLESSSQIEFMKFRERVIDYNNNTFTTWLNDKYLREEQYASN